MEVTRAGPGGPEPPMGDTVSVIKTRALHSLTCPFAGRRMALWLRNTVTHFPECPRSTSPKGLFLSPQGGLGRSGPPCTLVLPGDTHGPRSSSERAADKPLQGLPAGQLPAASKEPRHHRGRAVGSASRRSLETPPAQQEQPWVWAGLPGSPASADRAVPHPAPAPLLALVALAWFRRSPQERLAKAAGPSAVVLCRSEAISAQQGFKPHSGGPGGGRGREGRRGQWTLGCQVRRTVVC